MKKKSLIILSVFLAVSVMPARGQAFLSRAVEDGRADSAWAGAGLPQGYTGQGVIIGFTDWGFDYSHPVFYDTNMLSYRVIRAWDQFKTAGPPPEGYDYGTEYVGAEELLTAKHDTASFYDYGYHATHVASIAGGAGAGTRYRGVAFEAELMFASLYMTEQAAIDAWNWMYRTATAEGKRLVINMSWGLYFMDNMDGTGILANEMQRLSDLGVVFVVSAGNNGDPKFHLNHHFEAHDDTIRTQFQFPYQNGNIWGTSISMTSSPLTPFRFAMNVMDNSGTILTETAFISTAGGDRYVDTFLLVDGDTIEYNYRIQSENPYNQTPVVRLRVRYDTRHKFGLAVTASGGDFHAWNVAELFKAYGNWGADFVTPPSHPDWLAGDSRYGISTPANVDCAVTVAAHSPRFKNNAGYYVGGPIAYFSSSGPGFHELVKPEISAPGKGITAAISSYTNTFDGQYVKTVDFNGRLYRFAKVSGTSMAAPFVSGVAAMVLQANPYLSSAQVKEALTSTAYQDEFTEEAGIERFGYGKVNARAAVAKALEMSGMEEPAANLAENRYTLYPNPAGTVCYLTVQSDNSRISCRIFDVTGKAVGAQRLHPGVNKLDISHLTKGYYFVRIIDENRVTTKKLIRQ